MRSFFPIGMRLIAVAFSIVGTGEVSAVGDEIKIPSTTPLTRAIRIEHFAEAEKHITKDLVNQPDLGGYHPLTYAVYTRNQPLVKALLDGGADPNTVEHDGTTALSVAACLNLPDIIKTLHHADATYPSGAHACPPVANAVRADAVESLKVLLELYPALDINAGWPWPKDVWDSLPNNGADEINPRFARSALMFSTVSGYDEMARILLNHGADVSKKTNYGRHALHYAAQDCRISSETVAALVKAGLSPTAPSHHEHYQPSTPLELACATGSLEKVRILAAGLDARKQADVLRRAAMISAAHGQDEIVSFLYQTLGEKPPTVKSYIRDHPDPRVDSVNPHVPIPAGEISTPMPATHPNTDDAAQRPGTIAVISSPALHNHAAMLTQSLSRLDGLTVVERNEIDRIAEEKMLSQFGGGKPSGQSLDLKLIPAAQIVVLEDLKISDHKFIKVTLVSTGTRIVEQRMVLEYSDVGETWVETKLAALLNTVQRVKDRGASTVALSLVPLSSINPSPECLELTRYANLLLPVKASQQPGAVLLNLRQMRHLDVENAITGEGAYWKAGWVIEGTLALDSPDSARLVLAATPTGQGKRVEVAVEGTPEQLADAVTRAWEELAAKLSLADGSSAARSHQLPTATGEAELLAQQARWFVDAGYPVDAYELASAAFLLGNRSENLLRAMTEAAIDRLPLLQSRCSSHIGYDPRVMEPAIRFRVAAAIPDYLTLCDSARLYVSTLNKQLISKMRGQKSSSGRSDSYNDVVSHALSELCFFRQILNDSILKVELRDEIRNLDKQIDSLAVEFMSKCKDDEYESRTLGALVFKKTSRYPVMHDSELRQRILDRLLVITESNNKSSTLVYLLYKWANNRADRSRGPNPYAEIIEKLSSSPEFLLQCPGRAEQLRAITSADTHDRVASMRRMLEIAAQPETTFNFFNFDNRECERFLGSAPASLQNTPTQNLGLFTESHMLQGDDGGLILNPGEGFEKTGEFARLENWYLSILKYSRMDPSRLEERLKSAADYFMKNREGQKYKNPNTQACRMILKSINRLTPELDEILNRLAPEKSGRESDSTQDKNFKLKSPLSLPHSPGQSQLARWRQASLDGDQLWLPVTYFERPDYLWRSKHETNARRNAIHVIGLADHTVRTIMLPDEVPNKKKMADYFFGLTPNTTNPSNLRKVILGSKHAYYLSGFSAGLLYAIDRQTLEVKRVKLPLPYVIAMSAITRDDRLYLSISQAWSKPTNKGPKAATMVVAIEGSEIKETVVSNQRKPPRTPLDHPLTRVDMIDVNKDQMTLISNENLSYRDPESYQGAVYDYGNEVWKKLSKREVDHARGQIRDQIAFSIGHRHIDLGKKRAYFAHNGFRRGAQGDIQASLILVDDPISQFEFKVDWLKLPSKSGKIRLIPVSADPLVGETQMDRQMYCLEQKKDRGPGGETATHSANQIIEAAMYDASVAYKWRDQFLVFLTYRGVAMPAIWTAPESELQRFAQKPKTK